MTWCVIVGGNVAGRPVIPRRRRREEVDAVPVEIAAGTVVVLGGARVSMAGQDLGIAKRTPASSALVIAAWRSECGLMCRGMPAAFAILATIR